VVNHDRLRPRGPGDAPATASQVLSIDISRKQATVVVALGGVLDDSGSPMLVDLLWDLVVGQGNLSVAVDARRLTSSDPALLCVFQIIEWEAALRGGTFVVVGSPPPSAPDTRVRRAAALGRMAHPAGGARAP